MDEATQSFLSEIMNSVPGIDEAMSFAELVKYNISNCITEDDKYKTIPSYNGSILTYNTYCVDFTKTEFRRFSFRN